MNSIIEVTEFGFKDIEEMIKEDPAFVRMPTINGQQEDNFMLIVIVGNLEYLDSKFEPEESVELKRKIIEKFAKIFEVSYADFDALLNETKSFISSVNHPSKNILYGMSKAVFHKFELNDYQEDYFKSMKTPNPLFLKRMDEIMTHFIWDWDQFLKKHKFNMN
ncbi:hypothetical protein K6119_06190 [Paracrocinitomix mangrovi]|uniref:hypothetical protein n=1 Tax=Paracrocinitomix mangrovi TaxID=2862509 RepID=UPI001C8E885F|nr:hypothetical protein [Paracrocinitomix mangrovi]UKN03101.1 hypothetical protein K6119_06190 [Paracrocinitomix mangrovi]